MIFCRLYISSGATQLEMIIFLDIFNLLQFIYCKTEIKAQKLFWAETKYELFYTSYWIWDDHTCKVSIFKHAYVFVINSYKICILEILYHALCRKWWCDQVHWIDLLKKIHTKFNLHFTSFIWFTTKFGSLKEFLEFKSDNQIWKLEKGCIVLGSLPARGHGPAAWQPAFAHGPRLKEACHAGPAAWPKSP
jgi:hypothetical protein